MNVVVIPDGAMIIVPFIEKNGHTYLSPTNFSKYDNELNLNIDFDNLINSYLSSEVPSGVRGRISLLAPVLKKADAAIILGSRPPYYSISLKVFTIWVCSFLYDLSFFDVE